MTHAVSKIKEADDPRLKPDYQKKAGKAIDQNYSYVDHGYYNSWDELYGVRRTMNTMKDVSPVTMSSSIMMPTVLFP